MTKKRKLWKLLPLARAIGVLSAVGIVTTLVTFAAIQSSGSALTGNTIQTATAALQISLDGVSYGDSVSGYSFSGIVPGGPAQPVTGYNVYVKNSGTATLRLQLTVPTQPTVTGTVDPSKVHVLLIPAAGGSTQSFPLSDLIAGQVDIASSSLAPQAFIQYKIQASMTADAVSGNGATISGLNLSFSGTL